MPILPGADQAISSASERGYEAVVLVIVVLAVFGLMGWLVRFWITKASEREDRNAEQALKREERLAARITELERLIHDQLMTALKEATIAIREQSATAQALIKSLETTRPCWWTQEKQGEVMAAAADRIAEHLIAMVEKAVQDRSTNHRKSAS